MKNFYVFNAGCIRRGLDSIHTQKYLEINGWTFTNNLSKADLIVVFTCGVVQANEKNSLNAVAQVTKKKSSFCTVIVAGCLPNINPESIWELGDFILLPTVDIEQIDQIVNPKIPFVKIKPPDSVNESRQITNYLIARSFCRKSLIYKRLFNKFCMNSNFLDVSVFVGKAIGNVKGMISGKANRKILPYFNISIARGCMSSCTFCATKLAIGRLRSRPQDKIVNEFKGGIEKGYKIVQLISEDTGCYGLDIGTNLPSLLIKLFTMTEDFKLNIIDYHPRWLVSQYNEIVPLLIENRDKIKEIFIPVQSGANSILQQMGRDHTVEQLKPILKELNKKAPCISLRTSLLIGFPGETEEDFDATKDFIRDIVFAEVTINRYEDRPNAPSSRMANKVDQETIESRAKFLVEHMNCHLLS